MRTRRTRRRTSLALAAALTAAMVAITPDARAAAPPAMAATVPDATTVALTWSADGPAVEQWVVHGFAADGTLIGSQSLPGAARRATFSELPANGSYTFLLRGVTAQAATDLWLAALATTPRAPGCTTVGCVAIDATATDAPITGVGRGAVAGTLHTDQDALDELDLRHARFSAGSADWFDRAVGAAQVETTTAVLYDAWMHRTRTVERRSINPWDDPSHFRTVMAATVGWHVTSGRIPTYFEPLNEPDQPGWFANGPRNQPLTPARAIDAFEMAHDAVRQVLPDAKIIGPSTSYLSAGDHQLDLGRFLDHVGATGLQLDAISWHEAGGSCDGTCDAGPRSIVQAANGIRAYQERYPSLAQAELHVNEFGDPQTYRLPGTAASYFAALEAAGIDVADTACWDITYDHPDWSHTSFDGCFGGLGMVGGVLMPDGRTGAATQPVWAAYAQMHGTRARSATDRVDVSALASVEADGTVRALVGRSALCDPSLGVPCATGQVAQPASVPETVRIKVPARVRSMRVTVEAVAPSGWTADSSVVLNRTIAASGGYVTIPARALPNGTAWIITATPN